MLQVRYDNELKRYMKTTGLRAKDLKALAKSQPKSKNRHRSRSSSSQNHTSPSAVAANPQFAAAQFMGLPLVSMPMGVGMPAGMLAPSAMGMLPHFSQVWTGQQYPGQPASAAMMGIAGHLAQGLYSNGYAAADGAAVVGAAAAGSTLSSAKPPMLTHDSQPLAMYRYCITILPILLLVLSVVTSGVIRCLNIYLNLDHLYRSDLIWCE